MDDHAKRFKQLGFVFAFIALMYLVLMLLVSAEIVEISYVDLCSYTMGLYALQCLSLYLYYNHRSCEIAEASGDEDLD